MYLVKVCWLTVVTYVICSRNCVTPYCIIWFSSVAGIVWRLVAPFDSQSALLPNVSIFIPYDSHCLASTRTVMSLFIWTNTYLSQIVHCMLRFFIHVDVFPCICRHVHCQCIIICNDIYVSLKWKVHFCYHLQKQCQKQIQLKLLLSIYC